jgi:broad specificity phosphatase PhoE
MGRLVLIRHAESEGNRDRTFTRSPDVPLTEVGHAQAQARAGWVASRYRPVRVVASPYARARATATIIADRLSLPVAIEDDLREQSYGELAGRPYGAVVECGYDRSAYWSWCPPGGETLVEVAARAGPALDRVAAAAPGDDVVVVSHGGVMMALWRHVTGEWRAGKVAANAGVVVVEHDAGRYLRARAVDDG